MIDASNNKTAHNKSHQLPVSFPACLSYIPTLLVAAPAANGKYSHNNVLWRIINISVKPEREREKEKKNPYVIDINVLSVDENATDNISSVSIRFELVPSIVLN